MKHKFLLAFVILLTAVFTNPDQLLAQQGRVITLKEAIDLSIKNSKQLKGSKARIEEATASMREALERKLPEIKASGSYLRLNNPNINVQSKSTNSSGGSGTLGTPQESAGKPSSAIYGMLNASLPIYSGLRIRYGIESSKYLEEAAKLDADNDREAVVLNTINAFDNLYKSRAAVELVNESLQGARQRVKDFSNLEKNGILPRNDLLKAQLQQSNTELSLLDAENNWRLANINMNLMLGLPDTTVLTVNETDLQLSDVQLKPVEEYVQLSTQNRKDIAALALRKKAANTGVKAAKGGSFPSVAVTGGYVAADIPNVFTVTNAVNVGVGVQYSLSSLWKNSQVEQAKAREKQVEASEEILNDNVRLEVNQAYQNYLSSRKKIEVYQTAIAQAEENFKIVRNKFQNQLATTTDLLDADVAQLQARLNAAFAKADASVAYNKLLQTAGLLLNKTETK
ncbi:TolC family protein [Segetibacter aerophilus]|uniref:Transporter n=1 Tax=Segetibacter aerophilus TaxID=670293 RepID=A0A512B7P1_9BACT|nr:TolC family protein [Segetibacter aerophilus]GEO07992.1 transporter [Segetibacter aerophilus]